MKIKNKKRIRRKDHAWCRACDASRCGKDGYGRCKECLYGKRATKYKKAKLPVFDLSGD